jgi:hypothetical protein
MKNKKGQEEIVGFVVIVVLVLVIGLVFLVFTLRNQEAPSNLKSVNIQQFLESTMEYTTTCAISYEPAFSKLSALIQECHSGLSTCISGDRPCSLARETLKEIIDSSFFIDEEAARKGYEFSSVYVSNTTEDEFITIIDGDCSGAIIGAEHLSHAFPGNIVSSFKLCF